MSVATAKPETKIVGLKPYKMKDQEPFNECDHLFAKVPEMKDKEVFELCPHMWVNQRARTGSDQKAEGEQVRFVQTVGKFPFSASFTIQDPETGHPYKICAYNSSDGNGPIPIRSVFDGDSGAQIVLHKKNTDHKLLFIAMMMNPYNENNCLGLKPPHGETFMFRRRDDDAAVLAQYEKIQKRERVFEAYKAIKETPDLLLDLARSLDPNSPYAGNSATPYLVAYIQPFLETNPDRVMKCIDQLDVNRLKLAIADAQNLGLLENSYGEKGWIFPKKDKSKGIVNYKEGDTAERQSRILEEFLTSDAGAVSKQYLLKIIETEKRKIAGVVDSETI